MHKDIEVARKYVEFVQERFGWGITNEFAQREQAQLEAQVAPLTTEIEAARYTIAIFENLGTELRTPGMLPTLPIRIRIGLPIDLLRRRPDVVLAETRIGKCHSPDRRRHSRSFPASRSHRGCRAANGCFTRSSPRTAGNFDGARIL